MIESACHPLFHCNDAGRVYQDERRGKSNITRGYAKLLKPFRGSIPEGFFIWTQIGKRGDP